MSKILLIILSFLLLIEDTPALPDYRIFTENGKQGLMNETGKVVIPAQFESLGWSYSIGEVRNNRIGFKKDGRWGVVSVDNKVLYPAILEAVYDATSGFIISGKKQISGHYKKGLINYEGKTLINFVYNDLYLYDTYVTVNQNGNWGLLKIDNKIIIPIQFSRIKKVNEFRWLVMNNQFKGALFNSNGGQLTEFILDDLQSYHKNVAIASVGNFKGLLNNNGEWILKPEYKNITISGNHAVGEYYAQYYRLGNPGSYWPIDSLETMDNNYILYASGNSVILNHGDTLLTQKGVVENISYPFALLHDDETFGLYDLNEQRYLLEPKYHSAELLNNVFIAGKNDSYSFFQLPEARRIAGTIDKYYKEGSLIFYKKKGFWGVIDDIGKEILPPVYDQILDVHDEKFVVQFHGSYGIVDQHQNWIIPPTKDSIIDFNEKIYLTFSEDLYNLYTFNGDRLYFSPYTLSIKDTYIEEQRNGTKVFINFEGVSFTQTNLQVFEESEGFIGIKRDGRFGFIDKQGRLRIANRYEDIRPFREGIAAVKIQGSWGAINKAERLIVQPLYNEIASFVNGTAIVRKNNRFGLISNMGKVLLNIEYDEIIPIEGGYYRVKKENKSGVVNKDGLPVIWPKYDQVIQTQEYFIVLQDNKRGLYNKEGIAVLPPLYEEIISIPFTDEIFIGEKKRNVEVPIH